MLESSLETKVREWCKREGHLFIKLSGQRGVPDRLLITSDGQVLFLEFKRPDGKGRVSVHQELWLQKLANRGQRAAVVESLEDVICSVG